MSPARFPADLRAKVKARLQAPANLGLLVWVERTPEGWLVHANTGPEADRRMQLAHQAGHDHALAADVMADPVTAAQVAGMDSTRGTL